MSDGASISVEDIRFTTHGEGVRGVFLTRYYFDLPVALLQERIGACTVERGTLLFPGVRQEQAEKRMQFLLQEGMRHLHHVLYDKPTVYITEESGIPLVGTNEFGIVDRGSNILEIKPLTGCNFQCNYCSVDEGRNTKTHDYLVECSYLVQEAATLAARKTHPVEFNIGPQGEPFLYPKLVALVRGLRAIPNVAVISVNTNGSFLTEKLVDDLAAAGLTRINLSLNALDQEVADTLAGRRYPLEQVLRMIKYCQGRIAVLLAPTIVPGYNEGQVEGLVQLGATLQSEFPTVGFQNFLEYKRGRNVAQQRSFEEFFALLAPHEQKHGINLTHFTKEDFRIFDEPELAKPFKKGDLVKARVILPARYRNEVVAAAQERCITVLGDDIERTPLGKEVRVRIVRDKHNIFKAVLA